MIIIAVVLTIIAALMLALFLIHKLADYARVAATLQFLNVDLIDFAKLNSDYSGQQHLLARKYVEREQLIKWDVQRWIDTTLRFAEENRAEETIQAFQMIQEILWNETVMMCSSGRSTLMFLRKIAPRPVTLTIGCEGAPGEILNKVKRLERTQKVIDVAYVLRVKGLLQ